MIGYEGDCMVIEKVRGEDKWETFILYPVRADVENQRLRMH